MCLVSYSAQPISDDDLPRLGICYCYCPSARSGRLPTKGRAASRLSRGTEKEFPANTQVDFIGVVQCQDPWKVCESLI
jgi:hypothetical protein